MPKTFRVVSSALGGQITAPSWEKSTTDQESITPTLAGKAEGPNKDDAKSASGRRGGCCWPRAREDGGAEHDRDGKNNQGQRDEEKHGIHNPRRMTMVQHQEIVLCSVIVTTFEGQDDYLMAGHRCSLVPSLSAQRRLVAGSSQSKLL
ncbi:hypothetical protein HPP92_028806 [Vanilla planifolia]|uniref:Uncharacterized protein n=1 Tax=Vanilla planifolia TaxID=51239 RepID=A0A835P6P1_VANPL|nr:hypothetical protein HPP92_028806 [Vanilla planifolia]KAG0446506.1 hypothetical protein HPP92_028795 [Vanilla planifolia]